MKRSLLLILSVLLLLTGCSSTKDLNSDSKDVKYIFVHGLSGWGSYDTVNRFLPYWGMRNGSLMKDLRKAGFDTYAASVAPEGSAWDRACELYAQLTGSVVDYGLVHSQEAGHERYGKDYSKDPLVKDYEKSRFVLLGHSFGGITIRLFADVLVNGSEEERAATPAEELSPFFRGGDERVLALVTLATPNSGTTAYDLYLDPSFDVSSVSIPKKYEKASNTMNRGTKAKEDGRASWDYAANDMHIDYALEYNRTHLPLAGVYHLAVPCVATLEKDGHQEPTEETMPKMFMRSSLLMGQYTGETVGGYPIDKEWQANDGLVNTLSAGTPIGHEGEDYVGQTLETGKWYVLPAVEGEHMALQGGLFIKHPVKDFYLELLGLLKELVD